MQKTKPLADKGLHSSVSCRLLKQNKFNVKLIRKKFNKANAIDSAYINYMFTNRVAIQT